MNAIDKACAIPSRTIRRTERCKLAHQRVAELVIRIKRQDPGTRDLGQSEIALTRKINEAVPDHLRLRVSTYNFDRLVGTTTIDNDNASCPRQFLESPPDIGCFVEGEDEWS